MEELTIEQKAQRYDEIIERAKKEYKNHEAFKGFCEMLERIFFELKESEDEKIRGAIIDHLKDNNLTEWAAWLEKHSELKPAAEWSEEDELQMQGIIDLLPGLTFRHNWLKSLKNRIQPQPKQEWSEKDKNMLQSILDEYKSMPIEKRNWLKSLKGRVQPQPKQEWSEEDKKMLSDIIDFFKHLPIFYEYININGEDKTTEQFACNIINWLKLIKERIQPQSLTITNEELAQAKKDAYNDVLDKIEYDSENPTFDDGWSAAINYIQKKVLNFN